VNDVIALDSHGINAVALCSNRIAEGQIEKLVRWSKELANGKVTLMLDNDEEGHEGTMATIQKLASFAHISTVWTPGSHEGKYQLSQPEQLTKAELLSLFSVADQML
jgi:LDH2 family malate/lactate/ureidoglycolate dehydrogenase